MLEVAGWSEGVELSEVVGLSEVAGLFDGVSSSAPRPQVKATTEATTAMPTETATKDQ
jgi:hypothetical protein